MFAVIALFHTMYISHKDFKDQGDSSDTNSQNNFKAQEGCTTSRPQKFGLDGRYEYFGFHPSQESANARLRELLGQESTSDLFSIRFDAYRGGFYLVKETQSKQEQ